MEPCRLRVSYPAVAVVSRAVRRCSLGWLVVRGVGVRCIEQGLELRCEVGDCLGPALGEQRAGAGVVDAGDFGCGLEKGINEMLLLGCGHVASCDCAALGNGWRWGHLTAI